MANKKGKDVQIEVQSDAHWKDICKAEPAAVVEVYSELWGQCLCFKGITQRLYFDYMDKMKFYVACADKIESFAEFKDLPKPVFLLFKDGNKIDTIQGVHGPQIERSIASLAASIET